MWDSWNAAPDASGFTSSVLFTEWTAACGVGVAWLIYGQTLSSRRRFHSRPRPENLTAASEELFRRVRLASHRQQVPRSASSCSGPH